MTCGTALLRRLDLQQLRRREHEHAGDDAVGEHLARVVVVHHRVVERLARERDLVLGRGQLFGELHHVLVRLQVRISLGNCEQPAQRAVELRFGTGELLHGSRVARIGSRALQTAHGAVTCSNDGFESFALMLDITLGGLHQVRDQVVATRELHIDLCECVLVGVAAADQPVVDRNEEERDGDQDAEHYPAHLS